MDSLAMPTSIYNLFVQVFFSVVLDIIYIHPNTYEIAYHMTICELWA